MNDAYQVLSIIYDIVKNDPAPLTYLCTPHEIVLRQTEGWTSIEKHLTVLTEEKLVTIKKLDKIAICITEAGIIKAKTLKNNFVNKDFSIPVHEDKLIKR